MVAPYSFYSTYLAARLTGMAGPSAQRMANYCQSTAIRLATLPLETSQPAQPIRRPYNPLTDVDWKAGGQLNAAFSRKMALLSAKTTPQPIVESRYPSQAIATKMINDAIDKAHKPNSDADAALVLFSRRLAVFQNTWLNQANSPSEDKAEQMLQTFYWTQYAIACFQSGEPLKDKLRLRINQKINNLPAWHNRLKRLMNFQGDSQQSQQQWLQHIGAVLDE